MRFFLSIAFLTLLALASIKPSFALSCWVTPDPFVTIEDISLVQDTAPDHISLIEAPNYLINPRQRKWVQQKAKQYYLASSSDTPTYFFNTKHRTVKRHEALREKEFERLQSYVQENKASGKAEPEYFHLPAHKIDQTGAYYNIWHNEYHRNLLGKFLFKFKDGAYKWEKGNDGCLPNDKKCIKSVRLVESVLSYKELGVIAKDNRPENYVAPPNKTFEVFYFHDGVYGTFEVEIAYKLNAQYRPHEGKRQQDACSSAYHRRFYQ